MGVSKLGLGNEMDKEIRQIRTNRNTEHWKQIIIVTFILNSVCNGGESPRFAIILASEETLRYTS